MKRFINLFWKIDPAREEIYIAAMIFIISLLRIDSLRITDYPNYVWAFCMFIATCQVVFVIKSCDEKVNRWDYARLVCGVIITVATYFYFQQYLELGDDLGAAVFGLSTAISFFSVLQSARRAFQGSEYKKTHVREGRIMWSREG